MARCHFAFVAVCALASAAFAQPGASPVGANRPASLGANAAAPPPPVSGSLARPRRENPVVSVQEFVRLEGQMTNTLRGVGIVTGLNKTGDSGKEMLLALPLAKVYENNGIQLPDLKSLQNAKTAAIVTLSVTLPEGGGREGDAIDVYVQVSHSASSLRGGTLIVSPMMGPSPKDKTDGVPTIYAMASGPIVLEDTEVPTTGVIRGGAVLMRDIRPQRVGEGFNLILRPHFRSYQVARTIASEINDLNANLDATEEPSDPIAFAIDETMVHVTIPKHERANPTGFLANVMGKRFSPSLLDLPAMVVVNERTGTIIVTADVEISAVTIGDDKIHITTTTPAPTPSALEPQVTSQSWSEFGTTGTGADRARVQDLLEAFKQLNVPAQKQIQILAQIHQAGRLHARFIRQ